VPPLARAAVAKEAVAISVAAIVEVILDMVLFLFRVVRGFKVCDLACGLLFR
jgi:hypothetical protein